MSYSRAIQSIGACCSSCALGGALLAAGAVPASTITTAKLVGTGLGVATGYGIGRLAGSPKLGYALMGASLLYSLFMWGKVK